MHFINLSGYLAASVQIKPENGKALFLPAPKDFPVLSLLAYSAH